MPSPEEADDGGDAPVSKEVQLRLPGALAKVYPTEASANEFLARIEFPRARIPLFRSEPQAFWNEVLNTVPGDDLWSFVQRTFQAVGAHKEVTDELHDLASLLDGTRPQALEGAARPVRGCHAIVWTENERIREAARQWLLQEGLAPQLIWANAEMTSFGLNEANASIVATVIRRQRPELLFKVVGPNEDDYLIDQITVIGQDKREFPMRGVPVQLTLDDLSTSAARLHPAADSTTSERIRNAVRQGADGRTQRVTPRQTLLQGGFRTGDRVSIGSVRFAPIRVLLIGANPRQLSPDGGAARGADRFEAEAGRIREQARRGSVSVVGEFPHAQAGDLDEIVECRPDIIHLSCPGQDRALILEDAAGGPRLVPAEWFVSRLADQGLYYGLKLSGIVLNAGAGELIAPILAAAASTVIAHRTAVPEARAILFAGRLYRELSRLPIVSAAALLAIADADSHGDASGGDLVILPQPPRGVSDHVTEGGHDLAKRGL